MKVYVVTELSKNGYEEKFLDVFSKRPKAIEYIMKKYVAVEKMENCSKEKVVYRFTWPPGASKEFIRCVRYIYLIEKDI